MSSYLLSISIGPVQEFIAAARRTRDLWYGSMMLSEVSKSAALALCRKGATLIFPDPVNPENDLRENSSFNVANKLLVQLPEGLDPGDAASTAENAAKARWVALAEEGAREAERRGLSLRRDIWKSQIDDVIEFYAAWAPMKAGYGEARTRVERILAGRKVLRDFIPAKGREGLPKSSLDGARETVLADPDEKTKMSRQRAFIREGEHLDAIGIAKRLGGNPEKFVSVSRISADPWIRKLSKDDKGKEFLKSLSGRCKRDFIGAISLERFSDFPWEGEVLYLSRIDGMLKEESLTQYHDDLRSIKDILIQARKIYGEPVPYFAVLVADGDKMGKAISSLNTIEEHQGFSITLSEFSSEAKKIIDNNHGCTVYTGGDDVLAFLPLDTALSTAYELYGKFGELMNKTTLGEKPSLSIGIAVGHCFEMLEDLLNMGRDAEQAAKKGDGATGEEERNGLAISVTTRRNETLTVRRRWDSPFKLKERLAEWIHLLLTGEIPDKLPYDLLGLAREYGEIEKSAKRKKDEGGWERIPADVLRDDAQRVIKKKRKKGNPLSDEHVKKLLGAVNTTDDLHTLAREIIIARHFCSVLEKRKEETGEHITH